MFNQFRVFIFCTLTNKLFLQKIVYDRYNADWIVNGKKLTWLCVKEWQFPNCHNEKK